MKSSRDSSGAPEIQGYTQAYLDASSPRSADQRQLERTGFQGPEAAQIAAHATRDRKQTLTVSEVLAAHKEMAAEFGDQPERVTAARANVRLRQAQEPSCSQTLVGGSLRKGEGFRARGCGR